jgi:hypothetical protein
MGATAKAITSTYKKRTPPREKYADVSSFNWKKTEPLMRAWTTKVLQDLGSVAQLPNREHPHHDNHFCRNVAAENLQTALHDSAGLHGY